MTDTQRTIANLQTLLADNTTGAISEQDIRDAVASCYQRGHGVLSVKGASTASGSISTTYVKLTQFTTEGPAELTTPSASSDEIVIDEGGDWAVHVQLSVTLTGGTWTFAVFVDGAESSFTASITGDDLGTSGPFCVSIHGIFAAVATDHVDIRAKNNAGGEMVTILDGQLMVQRVNSGV